MLKEPRWHMDGGGRQRIQGIEQKVKGDRVRRCVTWFTWNTHASLDVQKLRFR